MRLNKAYLIILAVMVLYANSVAGQNLLENGGFENADENGKPIGWGIRAKGCRVVTDNPQEGKCCLQIPHQNGKAAYVHHKKIPVKPGTQVTISVWARADGFLGHDAHVLLDTPGFCQLVTDTGRPRYSAKEIINKGWVQLSCSGIVPEGTTNMGFHFKVWNFESGAVCWDDVSVTVKEESKILSSAIYRFDFEKKQSPTFPGFRKITADDKYDKRKGYGWITEEGSKLESIARMSKRYRVCKPDPLCNDFCYANGAKFRIDLKPEKYKVALILGDIGKWWAAPGLDWYKGHEVKVNGERAAYRAPFKNREEYNRQWFFRDYYNQYYKGEDVWERYVAGRF